MVATKMSSEDFMRAVQTPKGSATFRIPLVKGVAPVSTRRVQKEEIEEGVGVDEYLLQLAPFPRSMREPLKEEGAEGLQEKSGLLWPKGVSEWGVRCSDRPANAWRLWSALRCLGLDAPKLVLDGGLAVMPVGHRVEGRSVVAVVGQAPVVLGRNAVSRGFRLLLGRRKRDHGSDILVPGPSIDDKLFRDGPARLLEVFEAEVEHAQAWLKADRALGLVALCGPLSRRTLGGSSLRWHRLAGYVDGNWALTDGGWWRLAYEAEQGVNDLELRRARLLNRMRAGVDHRGHAVPPNRLRRQHTIAVQRVTLRLAEEEELVPLGVEQSATASAVWRLMGQRSDALLSPPDASRLVVVEVLKRHEDELTEERRVRYARMRRDLPVLAGALGRPVELFLVSPGDVRERRTYQPDDEDGSRLGQELLDMDFGAGPGQELLAETAGLES